MPYVNFSSWFGQIGNRHGGMQLLGKVQGRRVLKPVNLSSLKRENLGNDPRVNLVPSGSGGWGQKEQPPNQQHQQTQDSAPVSYYLYL